MKKVLKWTLVAIVAAIILVMGGLMLAGGHMVKTAVNHGGPMILGVPVKLEHAVFRPLAGKIRLRNLHVGNPEGFKTPALFELGEVDIHLNVRSLMSDTIVIHKIVVVSPHITFEKGLRNSNFGALLDQLGSGKPEQSAKTEDKTAQPAGQKPAKRVVIEDLLITNPALNVSLTVAGGRYIPVKLGEVELKDIGKEGGGIAPADAIKIIFSVIAKNVQNAVLGAGDLLRSGIGAVGDGAAAVGDAAGDGAAAVVGAVGDGAAAITGAAGDGAAAAAGAVGDGAAKIGGALSDGVGTVGDGAASAVRGLRDLVGGTKDE